MTKRTRRWLADFLASLERLLGVPMTGAASTGGPGTTPIVTALHPWQRER